MAPKAGQRSVSPARMSSWRNTSNRAFSVSASLWQTCMLRAVFDLDSPSLARFDADDARGFAAVLDVLVDATDWPAAYGLSI